jgi:hypothetical protein
MPWSLYLPGKNADIQSTGGWVGSTPGLDSLEKRKSLAPTEIEIPKAQPVTNCDTYYTSVT